ncbi:MAG: gamma carbonic anhydrase family protein [Myxococcota bacterium]
MSQIRPFKQHQPTVAKGVYIDPHAVVIGDVILHAQVNLWPGVVLRGDQGQIVIGERTNIQDGSIAHATGGISTVSIGADCTVGHRVILHGCTVEDRCLIGMGAIVLDNAVIGTGSIVGAGALVTAGTIFPPNSMILGAPAKRVRELRPGESERWILHGRDAYLELAEEYQSIAEVSNE